MRPLKTLPPSLRSPQSSLSVALGLKTSANSDSACIAGQGAVSTPQREGEGAALAFGLIPTSPEATREGRGHTVLYLRPPGTRVPSVPNQASTGKASILSPLCTN